VPAVVTQLVAEVNEIAPHKCHLQAAPGSVIQNIKSTRCIWVSINSNKISIANGKTAGSKSTSDRTLQTDVSAPHVPENSWILGLQEQKIELMLDLLIVQQSYTNIISACNTTTDGWNSCISSTSQLFLLY
jgi:hypothetical protein